MFAVTVDYVGLAAVIAAIGTIVTSVLQYKQRAPVQTIHDQIQTGNGRTLGQAVAETAAVVAPHDEEDGPDGNPVERHPTM